MLLSSEKWKRVEWVNGSYLTYLLACLSGMASSLKRLTYFTVVLTKGETFVEE